MTTINKLKKIFLTVLFCCLILLTACDFLPVQSTPDASLGTPETTSMPSVTVEATPAVTPTVSSVALYSITAAVSELQLYEGEQLDADQYFTADGGQITYSVSNGDAKLNGNILTALKQGECILTASIGDVSASITVKVLPLPDKKVFFDAGEFLALPIGQSVKMVYSAHAMYQNKVVLESQGECIEFKDGIVTALEKGVGSIIASVDGQYAGRCNVVVSTSDPLVPLSGINPPQYSVKDGVLTGDSVSGDSAIIMLTGDIMCLSAQQNAVKKNGKYDFTPSFKYIKNYFDKADFVMGNLESITSVSYPYANQQKNMDGKPNCNGPSTLLDALRYAGYDAVATANNHSLDAGQHGLYETLERLEYYRLSSTGTYGKNQKRYILAQINGIKVAFMSYTDIMNKRSSVSSELYSQLIGEYSKQNVERDCQDAKNDGAEFIVAYMHWGKENTHELTSKQKNMLKKWRTQV